MHNLLLPLHLHSSGKLQALFIGEIFFGKKKCLGYSSITSILVLHPSRYLFLGSPAASLGSKIICGHVSSLPYQAGMIRTDEDEYFIEPLERGKQMEEEKGRIHMVYRRSAIAQHPTDMLPDVHTEGTVPHGCCLRFYSR